jgi:hypothetical protein
MKKMNDTGGGRKAPVESREDPPIVDCVPQTATERAGADVRDLTVTVLFWLSIGLLWVPFQISCLVDRLRSRGPDDG